MYYSGYTPIRSLIPYISTQFYFRMVSTIRQSKLGYVLSAQEFTGKCHNLIHLCRTNNSIYRLRMSRFLEHYTCDCVVTSCHCTTDVSLSKRGFVNERCEVNQYSVHLLSQSRYVCHCQTAAAHKIHQQPPSLTFVVSVGNIPTTYRKGVQWTMYKDFDVLFQIYTVM